jgi:hypothetical protein
MHPEWSEEARGLKVEVLEIRGEKVKAEVFLDTRMCL